MGLSETGRYEASTAEGKMARFTLDVGATALKQIKGYVMEGVGDTINLNSYSYQYHARPQFLDAMAFNFVCINGLNNRLRVTDHG